MRVSQTDNKGAPNVMRDFVETVFMWMKYAQQPLGCTGHSGAKLRD